MSKVRDYIEGVRQVLFKDSLDGHVPGVVLVDEDGNTEGGSDVTINSVEYTSGTSQGIDPSTSSLQTVDYAHHELHAGSHFFVKGYSELDDTDTVTFIVIVPDSDKEPHMLFDIQSTGETLYGIYENVTVNTTGTVAAPINNNRRSTNESILTVGMDGTLTASGTQIYSSLFGVASSPVRTIGGQDRKDDELILDRNMAYAFIFTSNSNSNNLDYKGFWYEHTPKNA